MIRCALLALTLAAPLAAPAQVQRNFPANALRGEIVVQAPPELLLNNRAARLAPGARIRGADNMLMLSGALVGQRYLVNYTVDTVGLVKDVWLLRPEEAKVQPWPRTPAEAARWVFDPAAQTWTKR